MPQFPKIEKVLASPDVALPHIRQTLGATLKEVEAQMPAGAPKLSAAVLGQGGSQGGLPRIQEFFKPPRELASTLESRVKSATGVDIPKVSDMLGGITLGMGGVAERGMIREEAAVTTVATRGSL